MLKHTCNTALEYRKQNVNDLWFIAFLQIPWYGWRVTHRGLADSRGWSTPAGEKAGHVIIARFCDHVPLTKQPQRLEYERRSKKLCARAFSVAHGENVLNWNVFLFCPWVTIAGAFLIYAYSWSIYIVSLVQRRLFSFSTAHNWIRSRRIATENLEIFSWQKDLRMLRCLLIEA